MPTKAELEKSNASLRKRLKAYQSQLTGAEAVLAESQERLNTLQEAVATQDQARRDMESFYDERIEILTGLFKATKADLEAIRKHLRC